MRKGSLPSFADKSSSEELISGRGSLLRTERETR